MNIPYFLPDPTEMPKEIFKTKLFRALFYIPGIQFDLSLSDKNFPNIPGEYIFRTSADSSFGEELNGRIMRTSIDRIRGSVDWMADVIHIIVCRAESINDLHLYFNAAQPRWYTGVPPCYFDDCDFSSNDTKKIAEYLLGPSWETLLDNSTYNIQKNRFIHKYHLKKLLIESIECFSIVKYVLVSKLIKLEDDVSHIGTFGS